MIHAVKFVTALMIPGHSLRFVSSIYHFMTTGFSPDATLIIPEEIWFVTGSNDTLRKGVSSA